MSRSTAEIVHEHRPLPGTENVHGVTYDGRTVWFAAGYRLSAFDPARGKVPRSGSRGPKGRSGWESNLFVTRVTWIDGELWPGTLNGHRGICHGDYGLLKTHVERA